MVTHISLSSAGSLSEARGSKQLGLSGLSHACCLSFRSVSLFIYNLPGRFFRPWIIPTRVPPEKQGPYTKLEGKLDNSQIAVNDTVMVNAVTIIAATALGALLLYKCIIYPAFVSPLAKIPNAHWSVPISPAWMLWKRFRMQNNRTIQASHERLGPVVRLGPSEISISCVDGGIKSVYTGGFEKHEWYPRVFGSLG